MWMRDLIRSTMRHAPGGVRRRLEAWKTRRDTRRGVRLLPSEALEWRYREALRILRDRSGGEAIGDYLEFGVYAGNSLACMHRAAVDSGIGSMRLFGFDSFSGLPEVARTEDGGVWRPGQFCSDYEFTRECLSREGVDWGRVALIKGWYSETLTAELARERGIDRAGVIMVDCDLYTSARDALAFCAPLIRGECVIFFDDWYSHGLAEKELGERRAYGEFMQTHPFDAEDFEAYSEYSKAFLLRRRA